MHNFASIFRYYVLVNGAIVLERGSVTETRTYNLLSSNTFSTLPNGNGVDHALIAPFYADYDADATQSRIYVLNSLSTSGLTIVSSYDG